MAFRGIDIRETGDRLLFRAFLQNSSGAILATGTTTLKLYELQTDGTLKSYDFNDNTFKTTALTTETVAMTHRTGNNGATNTGIWSYALTTLTGFTAGNIYFAMVNNSGASPTDQQREFQFGSGVLADTVLVSGDSTAADNLEAACDGTTYNIGGGAVVAASVTGAVGSVTGAVGSVTGNVGGNVAGSVGSLVGHTAQTGDSYAYLGTNLGALGANATEAGGTGDQFTGLPNVTLANGAHGGAAAALTLGGGATISNAIGSALTLSSSGSNGSGLVCTGNGSGHGITTTGGTTGHGMLATGTGGAGIYITTAADNLSALHCLGTGSTDSGGIHAIAQTDGEGIGGHGAGNGHGMHLIGAGTGEGLHATAGAAANGHGAHFEGVGANSHGLLLSRGGAGGDDLKFANNDCTVPNVTLVATTTNLTNWHASVTDWTDGGRLDLIIDAILADTNELQTDDYPARFTGIEGATFNAATDSLEAIRDRGDAAWVTATGFSTLDAAGVRAAVGLAAANLDTQLSGITTYVDCLPATLDGSTFTSLPEVVTDAASRTASKADVSALATAASLATAQADLDILTGADGVTLATVQANYAPAKAGAKMDLLDTIMEDVP